MSYSTLIFVQATGKDAVGLDSYFLAMANRPEAWFYQNPP
jgi:hypothetical protein